MVAFPRYIGLQLTNQLGTTAKLTKACRALPHLKKDDHVTVVSMADKSVKYTTVPKTVWKHDTAPELWGWLQRLDLVKEGVTRFTTNPQTDKMKQTEWVKYFKLLSGNKNTSAKFCFVDPRGVGNGREKKHTFDQLEKLDEGSFYMNLNPNKKMKKTKIIARVTRVDPAVKQLEGLLVENKVTVNKLGKDSVTFTTRFTNEPERIMERKEWEKYFVVVSDIGWHTNQTKPVDAYSATDTVLEAAKQKQLEPGRQSRRTRKTEFRKRWRASSADAAKDRVLSKKDAKAKQFREEMLALNREKKKS